MPGTLWGVGGVWVCLRRPGRRRSRRGRQRTRACSTAKTRQDGILGSETVTYGDIKIDKEMHVGTEKK